MSKHWNPRTAEPGRAWRPRRRQAQRPRGRGRRSFRPSEIRLMLIVGVFLGLVSFQAGQGGWSEESQAETPDFSTAAAPDPYRESRVSKTILRRQENGPIPPTADWSTEAVAGTVASGDHVDVIDGDTFRFGGEKIRIADIDTPELNARCPAEAELADQATRRLAVLLAQGPFELEQIGRDEDRYGRKLRIVTRGGQSIGDQLVAEGLARTWSGRREPWCA